MRKLVISAMVFSAVGCVSNQNDLDETFGAAFNANNVAQIIDPTPVAGAPEKDGVAVDMATARYNTDTIKEAKTGEIEAGANVESQ